MILLRSMPNTCVGANLAHLRAFGGRDLRSVIGELPTAPANCELNFLGVPLRKASESRYSLYSSLRCGVPLLSLTRLAHCQMLCTWTGWTGSDPVHPIQKYIA